MLNSGTTKLDQILNMRQSMNNKNVIGYSGVVNLVAITSNTVFVKTVAKTKNIPVFGKNSDL